MTVEPYVVFGPGVTVESKAVIHAFSHLSGAHVGEGASICPYARLRPGAKIGKSRACRQFRRGQGSRDGRRRQGQIIWPISATAASAEGANIGAGTIFCNYDGTKKQLNRCRQGRFRRLQFGAGRAGQDRRRRLCRLRLGHYRRCAAGFAGPGARAAGC